MSGRTHPGYHRVVVPRDLEWEPGNPDRSLVFVDGGISPYNNPAFLLYRMATAPEYRLGWPSGEGRLTGTP